MSEQALRAGEVSRAGSFSRREYKKSRERRPTSSRTAVSILMFIIGIVVSIYPYVAQYINSFSDSKVVAAYNASVMNPTSLGAGVSGAEPLDADVYGTIFIPKLSLELPIYIGDTDANLSRGIAHIEGTSLPVGGKSTHSVLAGHNGAVTNEWFTHIDQMNKGDLFYIRNSSGVLTYKVFRINVINPKDTSSLYIEKDRDLVTLLTCIHSGTQRLLVTGERTQ